MAASKGELRKIAKREKGRGQWIGFGMLHPTLESWSGARRNGSRTDIENINIQL